jgi:hypothetical protein
MLTDNQYLTACLYALDFLVVSSLPHHQSTCSFQPHVRQPMKVNYSLYISFISPNSL